MFVMFLKLFYNIFLVLGATCGLILFCAYIGIITDAIARRRKK